MGKKATIKFQSSNKQKRKTHLILLDLKLFIQLLDVKVVRISYELLNRRSHILVYWIILINQMYINTKHYKKR